MAINIKTQWGIDENNSALQNSCAFITNFEDLNGPADLFLPSGTYEFNMIYFTGKDGVKFYGDTNTNDEPITIIKFKALSSGKDKWCQNSMKEWNNSHCFLKIAEADNFNIHDLAFDGKDGGVHEAGVRAHKDSTNGILKNLKIYDASEVSLVVDGNSSTNPAHDIVVEDCTVYGQRKWGGDAKAMILAGGYSYNITFKNCNTFSVSPYNNNYYSPADHFDTDNATNVEYHNCTANGSGTVNNSQNRKGKGFWNEAGGPNSPDHETSATYYGCTAYKTGGGLAATENSSVQAYDFSFDECSTGGWTARCQGDDANLEIYNSTFNKCINEKPPAYLEGGVHFSSGDGIIENCTFQNTQGGFNVSFYTSDPNGTVNVTLENNTFDKGAKSHGISDGSGIIYIINNDLGPNASYEKDGNYNWLGSATTTAVSKPTASTTVSVLYQNHQTDVQYINGESLDNMLYKMRDAINADSGAYITAEINTGDNTITFIQKVGATDSRVDILFDFSDWNSSPFNPFSPAMS